MEVAVQPCKPITPALSEFSSNPQKTSVSFKNARQRFPSSRITDAHLNYLCRNGRLTEAIAALDSIGQNACEVRPNTFARLLQSCIDSNSIHLGRKLHGHLKSLEKHEPFICAKLVGMYAKCGSLEDARRVFDEMFERDLYTWSAMIGACSRAKRWMEAVELFFLMMKDGVVPDCFLFSKILQACGNCGDVETGNLIHSIVIRSGMSREIRVCNSILGVYAKCGKLSLAKKFFERMADKDIVSWNSIIAAYCQKGEIEEAHRLFELLQEEGIEPSLVTWNIMITGYNQMGRCDVAMELMEEMESVGVTPDAFAWTSMISGFSQNKRKTEALDLFRKMHLVGVQPSEVTLTSAISACASLKALRKGKELHSLAVKIGFSGNVLVGNSLIDMYSKCGYLEAAHSVFDMTSEKDDYTWNSMIGGYCQAGYCGKAHELFLKMRESGVPPSAVTWNVLITGYIQNGDEDQAMDLFQRMDGDGIVKRDTASWNALIAGYLKNGHKNKALRMFRQMQSLSFRLNSITILSILPACSNLVASKKVREIHGCVFRRNIEPNLSVANSLIDAYAKSGNIIYSKSIFDGMLLKDLITWNTMIAGSVLHGRSDDAFALYEQMREEGLKPNKTTFVSMISAYGIANMVNEGKQFFSSMSENFHISPCLDHYVAMVHLFGRSGRLKEAIELIEDMAIDPDFAVWSALLTASRVNGNIRLAIHAGEKLLELEPENAFIQRLVLQMQASCCTSEYSLKLRRPGKRSVCDESLGCSWTEFKNRVHTFFVGDQCQPNSDVLYSWLRGIEKKIKGLDIYDGLQIGEEEKEEISGVHSEKLALAFGLVNSQAFQSVRIMKDQRMCGNCHRLAKYISKTYSCVIYLNDTKCLHCFKDGRCSCGDYW